MGDKNKIIGAPLSPPQGGRARVLPEQNTQKEQARRPVNIIILLGAAAALGFAFYTQYFWKLVPCEFCIWQRYGYLAVILAALLALKNNKLKTLVSLALAVELAIAVYHSGIELHWWEGFTSCSSSIGGGSLEEIKAKLMNSPLVRCDEPQWKFAHLSMAAWNAVYAFLLLIISLLPCRKSI